MVPFILTMFNALLVYIIGQILSKFYIDPANELLKCIGEVENKLFFYADKISNPGVCKEDLIDEASKNIRALSSKLVSKTSLVRAYSSFKIIGYIPSKEDINVASSELIGLSNSLNDRECSQENKGRVDIIHKKLGIYKKAKFDIFLLALLMVLIVGTYMVIKYGILNKIK